jgi:hypothetical protein
MQAYPSLVALNMAFLLAYPSCWRFLSVVIYRPTFLFAFLLACIFCFSALMVVCVLLVLILPNWQLSLRNT